MDEPIAASHPITAELMRQFAQVSSELKREVVSNEDRFAYLAEWIGKMAEVIMGAVSSLETEVILLREVVHGNDPELRLR